MLSPLALLLSVVILSTTGSTGQKDAGVRTKDVFPDVGEYLFDSVPRNWTDAFQFCNRVAGHLAVINSEAEKAALTSMMTQNGVTSIHLGFHDRLSEGDYYTVTDQPIGSSQWAVGYPRGGLQYNCGGFTADGFIDTDCAADQVTICEYAATKARPEGYELISGLGYYKFYTKPSTWVEAWKTCKTEGAYLHILNSQEEQNQLFSKYPYTSGSGGAWVGVHRMNANNDNEFHTIFGEPLANTGFAKWYNKPLVPYSTYPYVYSYLNERLATKSATDTMLFICEIDEV